MDDDRSQNEGQYEDGQFGQIHGLSLLLSAFLKAAPRPMRSSLLMLPDEKIQSTALFPTNTMIADPAH
ncbi:MAG: hypothetical protein GY938_31875 [Ketobacter sp.]|nr:hypothetical protein [Ketobacter sp.]